jgi:hypothetical protein
MEKNFLSYGVVVLLFSVAAHLVPGSGQIAGIWIKQRQPTGNGKEREKKFFFSCPLSYDRLGQNGTCIGAHSHSLF